MNKKAISLVLAVGMTVCIAIGGTLAWLTDTTEEVKNTFTDSNIDITLTEAKPADRTDIKMVPGDVIEKNPVVTVEEGSEPCWLFIKVDASENIDTYLSYAVDTSIWAPVPGHADYWYCKVDASNADVQRYILADNQVMVKESVDKADMDAIADGTNYPYLEFMAAAVQEAHIADVAAAWAALDTDFTGAA